MKIKTTLTVLIFCLSIRSSLAQTIFLDENNNLARTAGTALFADQTAQDGQCIFRSANAEPNTMWFGPYIALPGGQYLVTFRLKVSSNASHSGVVLIDIVSSAGGIAYGSKWIVPDMFKSSNSWEMITIPITLPNGISNLETRGIGFQPGITDISLDYIQISPGAVIGSYSPEFTLTNKGEMGLGTSNPQERLSVNGKIRAHEIKVEAANWPDYVFRPGYHLPTLTEIEEHIKAKGHLKNMPSAKEVEANGVALGEMIKQQQEKIEELTLYLIEQNKTMMAMKNLIEELRVKPK